MKKSIGTVIVGVLALALIGYGVLNAGKSKRESAPLTQADSTGEKRNRCFSDEVKQKSSSERDLFNGRFNLCLSEFNSRSGFRL